MINLKCLGNTSDGNCYILQNDNEAILLDAGVPIKNIKIGLDFNVSKLKGVLVTHCHKDHFLSVSELKAMGKTCICPWEKPVNSLIKIGGFNIQPFELTDLDGNPTHSNADGTPCRVFGYLISEKDLGRLLYITDTYMVKYSFKNIDHLLLGVNYINDMISNDEDSSKRYHVNLGHLELDSAVKFIGSMVENNNLKNIIITHCSNSNSDTEIISRKIIEVSGNANVVISRKGEIY